MSTDPNEIINSITSLPEDPSNPLDKGKPAEKSILDDIYKGTPLENSQSSLKYEGGINPYYSQADKIDLSNTYKDPTESYIDYDVPLNPFAQWDDIRAENQTFGEKLAYGVTKMIGTGIGAVAENTVGVVGGLVSLAEGKTYADNGVGRMVDDINEWLSKEMPHYYTQKELDPDRAWYDNLGTANFWTDKFANGVGYLLGSLGTVYLTGGSGLATRLGTTALNAERTAAGIAGAINKGEKIKNIYNASKIIKSGAKLTDDIATQALKARGLNAVRSFEIGAMMSLGEASVEAREKSKSYIDEQFRDWEENNPGKIAERDMPLALQDRIYSDARSIENSTFALNMALLIPTNLMQASVLMGNKFLGKMTADRVVGDIIKKEGQYMANLPKGLAGKFSRANSVAAPIYKSKITEAFQEGAQFFIGEAGSEYYKNKFNTGVEDIGMAMSKALSSTFGTAEGQESMLIGALIGGLGGTVSTTFGAEAGKRKLLKSNTERVVNMMNSSVFVDIKNEVEKSQEAASILSGLKAARELGNEVMADQLMKEYIFSRASKLREMGAEDLGITEIQDLKDLSDEEFAKRIGLDPTKKIEDQTGGKSKNILVEEYIQEYKKALELDSNLNAIVESMNPSNFGVPDLLKSKDRKYRDSLNRYYNTKLKNILMSHLTGIDSIDTKLDTTIQDLRSVSPEFASINLDDLLLFVKDNELEITSDGKVAIPKGLTTTELTDKETEEGKKVDKNKEKIKNLFKTAIEKSKNLDPIKKQKFENSLFNFLKYSSSREESIKAFEELTKNPEARQLAILAKEQKLKQSKIENKSKDSDTVIGKAQTSEDLEEIINDENLSPEIRERAKKKYNELLKKENEYVEAFKDLPDKVLTDLLNGLDEIEANDPQKALALKKVLEIRRSETSEEKTKRETNSKKSFKSEVDEAFKAKEKVPENTKYKNKIAKSEAAINKIFVNGTLYEIKYSDFSQAIKLNSDNSVLSVTLHSAENGQETIFINTEDNKAASEIAEFIYTNMVSGTSIDTKEGNLEGLERGAQDYYDNFLSRKNLIDERIQSVLKTKDIALLKAGVNYVDKDLNVLIAFKDGLIKMYAALNKNVNDSPIYDKIKNLVDEYNLKKSDIQKEIRTLTNAPDSVSGNNIAVKVLTEQEEKDLQNEIGELEKRRDELLGELETIEEEISVAEDEELINSLKDRATSIQVELVQIAGSIEIKKQEYENRKPNTTDGDVQGASKPEEAPEKQGPGGEGEGAGEVSEDQEPTEGTEIDELSKLFAQIQKDDEEIKITKEEDLEDIPADQDLSNPFIDVRQDQNNKIVKGDVLNVRIISTEHQNYGENEYDYIIVDKDGEPLKNEVYQKIQNDTKKDGAVINIDQKALTSESEVPTRSELSFELISDKSKTETDWRTVPIHVKVGDRVIGLLESDRQNSEDESDRKKIFDSLKEGKKVTSILKKKLVGKGGTSVANAVTKKGDSYFYNILVEDEEGNKVIPNLVMKGKSGWRQILQNENSEPLTDSELGEMAERDVDNGSIGLVTENVNGGIQLLKLQTEKIGGITGKNNKAYSIIVDLLRNGDYGAVSEIVGFNLLKDQGVDLGNKNLFFNEVIKTQEEDINVYTFYVDEAESYIKIDGEELTKALNKKSYKYQFVNIVEEVTEDGKIQYNTVRNEDNKLSQKDYYPVILKNFEKSIKNKRFQVSESLISNVTEAYESPLNPGKIYNNYIEYLTDPDIPIDIKAVGHTSILKSDVFINEYGSPHYNIGIEFEGLYIDGELINGSEIFEEASSNLGGFSEEYNQESLDKEEPTAPVSTDIKAGIESKIKIEPIHQEILNLLPDYSNVKISLENDRGGLGYVGDFKQREEDNSKNTRVSTTIKYSGIPSSEIYTHELLHYFTIPALILYQQGNRSENIKQYVEALDKLYTKAKSKGYTSINGVSIHDNLNEFAVNITNEKSIEQLKKLGIYDDLINLTKNYLNSLQSSTSVSTDAKADIEKRRQEDLFSKKGNDNKFGMVEGLIQHMPQVILDVIDFAKTGLTAQSIVDEINKLHNFKTPFTRDNVKDIREYLGIPRNGVSSGWMGSNQPTAQEIKEAKEVFQTWVNTINEINAKYDLELARELYKEMKAGKLVTEMTPDEQKVVNKYITSELKASVDAELATLSKDTTGARADEYDIYGDAANLVDTAPPAKAEEVAKEEKQTKKTTIIDDEGNLREVTEEEANSQKEKVVDDEELKELENQEDPIIKELNRIFNEEIEKDKDGNPLMNADPKTKEDVEYVIKRATDTFAKGYRRITKIVGEQFVGDLETREASSKAGNTLHDLGEKMLLRKDYERPSNLSRVAFLEFKIEITKVLKLIEKNNQKILATEMIVYSETPQFAGKFDILVKSKNGYHIYDIKTGSQKGLDNYDIGFTDKETKRITRSKRDQHGSQLSLYAYALRGIASRAGVDLKNKTITGSVLYFPIEYDTKGNISHVNEFKEKKFTLNFDAFKVIKEKPSFLNKEEKSTDPSIANAGKKKGGNAPKVRKGEVKTKEEDEEKESKKTTSKKTSGKLSLKTRNAEGKKINVSLEDVLTMFEYFEDKNDIDAEDSKQFQKLKRDIKKTIESGNIKEVANLDSYLEAILSDQVIKEKDKPYTFSKELENSIYDSIQEYNENEEYKEFCKS